MAEQNEGSNCTSISKEDKIELQMRSRQDNNIKKNEKNGVSISQLKKRCKILLCENQQLEEIVHKCRTEHDVETTYLKNQIKNERERQRQWKDLYFRAYSELMELKRHNLEVFPSKGKDADYIVRRSSGLVPRTRTDSGCQECEDERKRKASESEASNSHSLYPGPLLEECISVSNTVMSVSKPMLHSPLEYATSNKPQPSHHSPIETITEENVDQIPIELQSLKDIPRSSFAVPVIPNQVYKPDTCSMENQKQYFKCQICRKYYDSEQKLRFHMELHSERCTSGHPKEFLDNVRGLSGTDYYICPECNQSFSNVESYRQHLLVHMFKCRYCGQNMGNEMNYLIHIKRHAESNNVRPYFCFLCDEQFAHVTHLTKHVHLHSDEQPFECHQCGKHFARKGHMARHLVMHGKSRPYTCTDCSKTFAHRTHLRRHEIVHSGLRPHQCKVCHQSFSRKSSLSRHYFIHTTEKPFVCPVCEKGFNRKGRLKNHLKIHIREGYSELVDYVIERRPITKDFIEKINQVKPDVLVPPGSDSYGATNESLVNVASGTLNNVISTKHCDAHIESIKEESDVSSDTDSEEGDNDEVAANMSEEICHFQPVQAPEPNNNTLYPDNSLSPTATIVTEAKLQLYTTSPLNT